MKKNEVHSLIETVWNAPYTEFQIKENSKKIHIEFSNLKFQFLCQCYNNFLRLLLCKINFLSMFNLVGLFSDFCGIKKN